jgi:hypothetical protein
MKSALPWLILVTVFVVALALYRSLSPKSECHVTARPGCQAGDPEGEAALIAHFVFRYLAQGNPADWPIIGPVETKITRSGGTLICSKGRFPASYELQHPPDLREDDIQNVAVASITGWIEPKPGTPITIRDDKELEFEMVDGRGFAFSFCNDETIEIIFKRWLRIKGPNGLSDV